MKKSILPILCFLLLSACEVKTKPVSSCGDAFLDHGEECDLTVWSATDCRDLGYHQEGVLSCMDNCKLDVSLCGPYCGDGEVNYLFGEQCDLGNSGGLPARPKLPPSAPAHAATESARETKPATAMISAKCSAMKVFSHALTTVPPF